MSVHIQQRRTNSSRDYEQYPGGESTQYEEEAPQTKRSGEVSDQAVAFLVKLEVQLEEYN